MRRSQSLLRTVGSISSATMLSRVLGLVRDQVQSYYFGAGWVTDAYLAAFRIPNLLRDLFAEGALSSAFIPTFTAERERRGDAAAWRLANLVLTALCLVLGLLTLVIATGAPSILRVYVGGFGGAKMDLAITMTRILAPFLLFIALAAVAMGVLNTCGRFFLPAIASAWFNVFAILGVVLLVPVLPRLGWHPGLALAIGAIVGGAMQFLVQVPGLVREGFRFRPVLDLADPGLRRIGRLMLPATFGLAATQINILVDTILASRLGNGPITWLQLAFRLMQLPIGLFGVALATVNLTRVSRDAARGDLLGLRRNLAAALRAAALLTLPAAAGLMALREPIVRVLFEHGEFSAESTASTAAAVLCYAVGLYAYAVTKIQVPTFYALDDTRTPVLASATAVAFKITANFVLLAWLPRLGLHPFLGLALSTSLAAWVNFSWLGLALRRRLGGFADERLTQSFAGMCAVAAAVGLVTAVVQGLLERWLPGGGLGAEIGRLATSVAAGIATFGVGAWYVDLPESRLLFARLARRRGRGD